jgi:hypothetical protein
MYEVGSQTPVLYFSLLWHLIDYTSIQMEYRGKRANDSNSCYNPAKLPALPRTSPHFEKAYIEYIEVAFVNLYYGYSASNRNESETEARKVGAYTRSAARLDATDVGEWEGVRRAYGRGGEVHLSMVARSESEEGSSLLPSCLSAQPIEEVRGDIPNE